MKRTTLARWTTAVAIGVLASTGATARAQDATQITLVQGLPAGAVDVNAAGDLIVANFGPGSQADITSLAGQTLSDLTVVTAGTDDAVLGPITQLAVPATGNHSLIVHLDPSANVVLTTFANDVSAAADGAARLTIRHAADAGAVDLVLGDERPVAGLLGGQSGSLDLPAGSRSGLQIAPGGGTPVATLPPLDLAAGTNTIVYVTGSADGDALGFVVQVIDLQTGGAATTTTTATTTTVASGAATTTTTVAGATTTTSSPATSTTVAAPSGVGTGFPIDGAPDRTLVLVLIGGVAVAAGALLARSRLAG